MAIYPLFGEQGSGGRLRPAGRAATLSSRIVEEVREALFEQRLRPGDFLGTENEIAERAGVSRIVARDALRTLEALGIVEIKVGSGGGARVAQGDPRRFAEALAVQLDLAGVSAREIMDVQHAIECLAAELAARNATAADHAGLEELLADAEAKLGDSEAFTRSSRDFHLAIAAAAQNRVVLVQLVSLQHVSWPRRNRTLTRGLAKEILGVHRELAGLIKARDAAGARTLMSAHVSMIRSRRIAEQGERGAARQGCC